MINKWHTRCYLAVFIILIIKDLIKDSVSAGSAPTYVTTLASLKIKPELVVLEYLKPL